MTEQTTSKPAMPEKHAPAPTATAEDVLGGENVRGEVAACPTGLSRLDNPPVAAKAEKPAQAKTDAPER